jgi:hypothetical protein
MSKVVANMSTSLDGYVADDAVPAFHRGERWLFGLNVALRMEGPEGFDELLNTVPEAGSS